MKHKSAFQAGTLLLLGGAIAWAAQPALPGSILARLSQKQRLVYLQNIDTSDMVGYYCRRSDFPQQVADDIEVSIQEDHGVGYVGCGSD